MIKVNEDTNMKKFGRIIVQRGYTGNSQANKCLVTDQLPPKGTHRCRLSIDVGELERSERMLNGAKYGWISDEGVKELRANKGVRVLFVESIADFPQHLKQYEVHADVNSLTTNPHEGFKRIQKMIGGKQNDIRSKP